MSNESVNREGSEEGNALTLEEFTGGDALITDKPYIAHV